VRSRFSAVPHFAAPFPCIAQLCSLAGVPQGHRDPPRTDCARTKFVQAYEEKIWKPVKQYNTDMEILSSKRQQRNSLRLDYDAAFRVAQGYAKKPPRDPLKKQKADQAKETTEVLFNMVNQEVSSRMKFFVDGRVKFWSGILKAVLELEALSGMAVVRSMPLAKLGHTIHPQKSDLRCWCLCCRTKPRCRSSSSSRRGLRAASLPRTSPKARAGP
jgi:hypothetical protein